MNDCILFGDANWELIDTLWNVNEAASTLFALIMSELIETLWNVNNMQ